MKYIIPVLLFLSSCAMKPDVTEEQIAQYDSCKKTLLENRAAFISRGASKAKQDSLKDYIAAIEKHGFVDLLQKYEVPQEQVVLFLFSICRNAAQMDSGPTIDESMQSADSMIRALDSIIISDSLRNLGSQ